MWLQDGTYDVLLRKSPGAQESDSRSPLLRPTADNDGHDNRRRSSAAAVQQPFPQPSFTPSASTRLHRASSPEHAAGVLPSTQNDGSAYYYQQVYPSSTPAVDSSTSASTTAVQHVHGVRRASIIIPGSGLEHVAPAGTARAVYNSGRRASLDGHLFSPVLAASASPNSEQQHRQHVPRVMMPSSHAQSSTARSHLAGSRRASAQSNLHFDYSHDATYQLTARHHRSSARHPHSTLAPVPSSSASGTDGSTSDYNTSAPGSGGASAVAEPRRRASIVAIREFAASSGSPVVTDAGIVVPGFDSQNYEDFKRVSKAFRRWVAAIVIMREERKVEEEMLQLKLASALEILGRKALQRAFNKLVECCRRSRQEREKLIIALEHWSLVTMRKVLLSWRTAVVSDRPNVLTSTAQISAVFKWVALTLPEHYDWWKQRQQSQSSGGSQVDDSDLSHPLVGPASISGAQSYGPIDAAMSDRLCRLRSHVLRRIAPSRVKLPLLEQASARVDARLLAAVFIAWKERHQSIVELQRRCLRRQVLSALRGWRKNASINRRARAILKNCLARDLESALDRWVRYWRMRKAKIAARQLADARFATTAARSAVRRWYAFVQEQQRHRAAEEAEQRQLDLQRAMKLWRDRAARVRRMRNFMNLLRGNRLQLFFGNWKRYVAASKEETSSIEMAVTAIKIRGVFRSWKQALANQRAIDTLRNAHLQKRLRKVVAAWKQLAESQREHLQLRGRVRELKRLGVLFAAWRSEISARKGRAAQAATSARLKAVLRTSALLRQWHEIAAQRAACRRKQDAVIAHLRSKRLVEAVSIWHARAAEEFRIRRVMNTCVQRMKNATLLLTFSALKEHWQARKAHKQHSEAATTQVARLKAVQAVQGWHSRAAEIRKNRVITQRVLNRLRMRCVAETFAAWREYSDACKAAAAKAKLDFAAKQFTLLRTSFASWKLTAHSRAVARRKLQAADRILYLWRRRVPLKAWQVEVQQQVADEQRLRRAVAVFKNRTARAAFTSWKLYFEHRKHKQAMLQRAVDHHIHRNSSNALASWREWAAGKKRLAAAAAKVAHLLRFATRHSMLATVFGAWRQHSNEGRRLRVAEGAVQAIVARSVVARAFSDWLYARVAVSHHRQSQQRRCLTSWKLHAATEAAVKRRIKARNTLLLAACFDTWNESVKAAVSERAEIAAFEAHAAAQLGMDLADVAALAGMEVPVLELDYAESEVGISASAAPSRRGSISMFLRRGSVIAPAIAVVDAQLTVRSSAAPSRRASVTFMELSVQPEDGIELHVPFSNHSVDESDGAALHLPVGFDKVLFLRSIVARWKHLEAAMAFDALRANMMRRRHKRAAAALAHSRALQRAFDGLREAVHLKQERRGQKSRQNALADAHSRKSQLRSVWRLLQGNVTSSMASTLRAVKHDQSVLQGRVRKQFRTWAAYALRMHAMRSAAEQFLAVKAGAKARAALVAWNRLAQEVARLNHLQSQAEAALRLSRMKRVVTAWRSDAAGAARRRALMGMVIHRMQNSKAVRAVAAWRSFAAGRLQERQSCSQLAQALQRKRALSSFRFWRQLAVRQRSEREAELAARKHRMVALGAAAFQTWKSNALQRKRARALCTSVLYRFTHFKVHAAFATWKSTAREMTKQIADNERAAALERKSALSKCFKLWSSHARARGELRMRTALAVEVFHTQRMRKAVAQWRATAASAVKLRARIQALQSMRRTAALHSVVVGWKAFVAASKADRLARQQAARAAMADVLTKWKAIVDRSRKQRAMESRRRLRVLHVAVVGWTAALRDAKAQRLHAARQRRIQQVALQAWYQRTALMRVVRVRQHLYLEADIRDRFNRLRAYAEHRKSKRCAKEEAVAQVRRGIQSRIMEAWRGWAQQSREYRAALRREQELRTALERRYDRTRLSTLRVLFTTWKTRVVITARSRDIAQRFTMKNRVHRLFDAWKRYASERVALKHSAEAVIMAHNQRMCATAFWGLREAVLISRADTHYRTSLERNLFRKWRMLAAAARIAAAEAEAAALAHHQNAVHRRMFLHWRSYAARRATLERVQVLAIRKNSARQARRALVQWKLQCKESEHERISSGRADKFLTRRLLAQTFAAWRGLCFSLPNRSSLDATSPAASPHKQDAQDASASSGPTMTASGMPSSSIRSESVHKRDRESGGFLRAATAFAATASASSVSASSASASMRAASPPAAVSTTLQRSPSSSSKPAPAFSRSMAPALPLRRSSVGGSPPSAAAAPPAAPSSLHQSVREIAGLSSAALSSALRAASASAPRAQARSISIAAESSTASTTQPLRVPLPPSRSSTASTAMSKAVHAQARTVDLTDSYEQHQPAAADSDRGRRASIVRASRDSEASLGSTAAPLQSVRRDQNSTGDVHDGYDPQSYAAESNASAQQVYAHRSAAGGGYRNDIFTTPRSASRQGVGNRSTAEAAAASQTSRPLMQQLPPSHRVVTAATSPAEPAATFSYGVGSAAVTLSPSSPITSPTRQSSSVRDGSSIARGEQATSRDVESRSGYPQQQYQPGTVPIPQPPPRHPYQGQQYGGGRRAASIEDTPESRSSISSFRGSHALHVPSVSSPMSAAATAARYSQQSSHVGWDSYVAAVYPSSSAISPSRSSVAGQRAYAVGAASSHHPSMVAPGLPTSPAHEAARITASRLRSTSTNSYVPGLDVDAATPRDTIRGLPVSRLSTGGGLGQSGASTGRRLSVSSSLSQRILDTFAVKGL